MWQLLSHGRRFLRRYEWQLQHLAAYLEILEADERLVLVIGVNYMDRANQVRRKEGIASCPSRLPAVEELRRERHTANETKLGRRLTIAGDVIE